MSIPLKKIAEKIKKEQFRIVFVGDSITSTEWVHPNWREAFEYVLKEELDKLLDNWKIPSWNIRCINSAFDGSTTRDTLKGVQKNILNYKPNLVIYQTGNNDTFFGVKPKEYQENIKKVVKKLLPKVDYLVIATDIAANNKKHREHYSPYLEATQNEYIKDQQENLIFVDLFEKFKQYDLEKFFTFICEGISKLKVKEGEIDPIHPNALGNAYIAKILLKEIFDIDFDPEKYIKDSRDDSVKYPGY